MWDLVEETEVCAEDISDCKDGQDCYKWSQLRNSYVANTLHPSGAALGDSLVQAYARANNCDRIAAFGGVLVVNRPVDRASAEAMAENYLEVVCAPDFEEGNQKTTELVIKSKVA